MTAILPFPQNPTHLIHGESLDVMRQLPAASFDVVLTDPPYCSAVRGKSHRASTRSKYTSTDAKRVLPEFAGDHRDQRGFQLWVSIWAGEAMRLVRPGGALLTFIDFRNVAAMVDAVQAAGWLYDGIVPWIKPAGRPRCGWFQTSRTEFVVAATHGIPDKSRKCGPAAVSVTAPRDRIHATQKPVELLKELLGFREDWQRVLDPFAGSASTLIAAAELGRQATGIECDRAIYELAQKRLSDFGRSRARLAA